MKGRSAIGLVAVVAVIATSTVMATQGASGASDCQGKGRRSITASPIALDDILYIQPMGLMIGGHVTPIDHGYFYIKGAQADPPTQAAVYAPMRGTISSVTRTVRNGDPGAKSDHRQTATYDDYQLTVAATCTFRVRFSNMVKLGGRLGDAVGRLGAKSSTPNLSVKAGELIGYTGLPTAQGIDVWVENDNKTLTGFVHPAQYTSFEGWKTHMVDLFDSTKEPLRSRLLGFAERDAAPRFGKIDYDVDGKLVGNWFRVGSGGYSGGKHGGEGYWDGHLAVVYDGNDPGQIEISFGNYQGAAQQFAVAGNTPDPATVDVTTGLVKYELGQVERYSADTGQVWDGRTHQPHIRARAGSTVMGTVLLKLVGKRKLKVEIFPGQRAADISGFDAGAQTYER